MLDFSLLTPRERMAASLLLQDLTEKEIAYRMGIDVRTLSMFKTSILKKFDVGTRIGLLLKHHQIGQKTTSSLQTTLYEPNWLSQ